MQPHEKIKIAAQSSEVLLRHLSKFTLSIFATSSHEWDLFSGTLFAVGDRFLVCTASHCLTAPALSAYWLMDEQLRYADDPLPEVIAAHRSPHDFPDVGILELNRETFAARSRKMACPIDRIGTSGFGRPLRPVTLMGSPGELMEKKQRGGQVGLGIVGISYNSDIAAPSSEVWNRAHPAADPSVDIMLDYPAGTGQTRELGTHAPCALPNPEGMSGGGLWDQGFAEGEMWSPEGAFLFGIQSSWLDTRRYVRAIQVIHWLRLVHEKYADLRLLLEERFPQLKTVAS